MSESYFVNGINVATVLTHVQTVDGFIGTPPLRQSDYTIPGRTGVVAAQPWAGPRPVSIGGIVEGATRAEYQTKLRALGKLCYSGGDAVALKRVLASDSEAVATARYTGGLESVNELSDRAGRVAVDFLLLDGYFYDEAFTDLNNSTQAAFAVDVPGDAPTSAIRVQFSAGSGAQRLTNTTTGDYVQYTGSTSTVVDLDVAAFTAKQGATNVISNVRSGTASYYWMRLVPGRNALTLTGGATVRLLYKAAYL